MSQPLHVPAIAGHLHRLFDADDAGWALSRLEELVKDMPAMPPRPPLSQRDVWLIAYADHVRQQGEPGLQTINRVVQEKLSDVVNGVHLLPINPWTSDDGFAVSDHFAVDPDLGTWADVVTLGSSRRLMLDAVVNHVSASHAWVGEWLQDGDGWVMEVSSEFDTSQVVRPRTTPLATAFEAPDGTVRSAWTTFGPDQVDLDYHDPKVVVAMTEVLLHFAQHGAAVIRLDAVGFLGKESGTRCMHLPRTHEMIKLWRTVLDRVAPGTLLITETNVPHAENISYFGTGGDEASLVYQFPLAPMVLAAFAWGNAQYLTRWVASLDKPPTGTTFFNFLGCHDGIGLRPLEGLLPASQIAALEDLTVVSGGGVSYRANEDGSQSAYELNTTFNDAMIAIADDDRGVARIAGAHAILLALQGVPGLWFGSLFGLTNDHDLAAQTGRLRSLNRRRVTQEELTRSLSDPSGLPCHVHGVLCRMAALRSSHPAFTPDSPQRVVPTPGWLFAVCRGHPGRRVAVIVSVSDRRHRLSPVSLLGGGRWQDRLAPVDRLYSRADQLVLPPYGVAWLEEVR